MKQHDQARLRDTVKPEEYGYHPLFGAKENISLGQPEQMVERLSLRQWIGISGAAFTTGLGKGTSLGKSLMLGLANVRLGYWWDSGIEASDRAKTSPQDYVKGNSLRETLAKWFPVQAHLFDEFLAKFRGPNSRLWYLSDGGHFENTAAYELIRRRVPLIIVCDCGADGDYAFEDLGQLVRMVRVDFGAEIEFLTNEEIEQLKPQFGAGGTSGLFGEPKDFAVHGRKAGAAADAGETDAGDGTKTPRRPHALLARVWYPGPDHEPHGGGASFMLVFKPSLSGDEPLDVAHYKSAYPEFPQESTVDQFFDEAQWESYRKLGRHIAEEVFPEKGDLKWFTQPFSNNP